MAAALAFDHLVWAVPDLAAGVADFASRSGVEPVLGGRHEGLGTANFLVGLTGPTLHTAYLEIIGPTPDAPTAAPARPFGIDALNAPRLAAWAVRSDDLDGLVATAAAAGVDLGEIRGMSRATPDGEVLSWRLTVPAHPVEGGVVPFGIDWGATPHPAARGLPTAQLRSWHATHPDPDRVSAVLRTIGAALDVRPGRTQLVAEVRGPSGSIHLG